MCVCFRVWACTSTTRSVMSPRLFPAHRPLHHRHPGFVALFGLDSGSSFDFFGDRLLFSVSLKVVSLAVPFQVPCQIIVSPETVFHVFLCHIPLSGLFTNTAQKLCAENRRWTINSGRLRYKLIFSVLVVLDIISTRHYSCSFGVHALFLPFILCGSQCRFQAIPKKEPRAAELELDHLRGKNEVDVGMRDPLLPLRSTPRKDSRSSLKEVSQRFSANNFEWFPFIFILQSLIASLLFLGGGVLVLSFRFAFVCRIQLPLLGRALLLDGF